MGKKRTSDGKEKLSKAAQNGRRPAPDTAPSNRTPPRAQAPKSSIISSETAEPQNISRNNKKQKPDKLQNVPFSPKQAQQASSRKEKRKKLPKLPPNAYITKRPLHRPAIPTPFSSSCHPKTLYLSHSSPFVPTLKRIRRLLLEISKRKAQSQVSQTPCHRHQKRDRQPLEPNGRLAPGDVEREIAEEGRETEGVGGEEVFVKATGRAIERALKVGVYFQGESNCRVRVEMGSVMAVDDIELRPEKEDQGEDDRENIGEAKKESKDEDVPETRVRMVSSVTVAVGLK